MRIIAGEFRGRNLLSPDGDITRPITDRVKQSLFDILSPLIPDSHVYDCFSGTGSMGLECLSRGAAHATFCEMDRSAVLRLKENIRILSLTEQTTVVSTDLFRYFAKSVAPRHKIDLIFLDPPYRFLREKPDELRTLARSFVPHMSDEALVMFRHDSADSLELPSLNIVDSRSYGSMTIDFLRRPATNTASATTVI